MNQVPKPLPANQYTTYGASRAVRVTNGHYGGEINIHLVLCAKTGHPFRNAQLADEICSSIKTTCNNLGFRLYGYCLMPDHLHVLLSPAESVYTIDKWLQVLKSYTAHWAKINLSIVGLWQRSAYDHVCRKGETAEKVMKYIMDNPVRAGLVDDWKAWLWSESFV